MKKSDSVKAQEIPYLGFKISPRSHDPVGEDGSSFGRQTNEL
ncbi:unnamed protein product [Linum tenue]|uniref:Uncharacterized protein n=1 Tax=Linum tenue TaxID=586396 RepID=A0AAV0NR34_9ROSI|nr:unnamed protein product [Linum tenue]